MGLLHQWEYSDLPSMLPLPIELILARARLVAVVLAWPTDTERGVPPRLNHEIEPSGYFQCDNAIALTILGELPDRRELCRFQPAIVHKAKGVFGRELPWG